jgi:radical SAM superfamily enzyme YgiQ (UPF0313 family)
MRILLLTPPFDLMKRGYGSKRSIRAGFFPPLGLGYIAAPLLPKGHDIKIIDASPLDYTNEDIGREVEKFNPDLIGVSAVTAMADEAYSLINYLKNKWAKVPIIFGGAHPSCFPELVFEKAPQLDMVGYGEGEKVFEEIIDYYNDNRKLPQNVLGTLIRLEDGTIKKNLPAPLAMDLDKLLPPTHHLYDYSIYRPLPLQYKKLPAANLIASRGCPWRKCTFCFQAGRAGQMYRRHSPERVIEEIKTLTRVHHVREIAFWDDNFLINEAWVTKFCDLLDQEGIKIHWSAVARVNTVTKTMLARAKKSGLWNIFFGVESGNQDLLDRINKGTTLDQIRQAISWTHDLDIDTRGSFILALPGETPAKTRETIKFACELDLTYAQFLPAHPEWGTVLYDDAIKSGRIVPTFLGRTTPTYVPDGYKDAQEVKDMLHLAYRKFYFRPKYVWKHFKRLRDPHKVKQYFDAVKYVLGVSF